jgi:hypothetical protein
MTTAMVQFLPAWFFGALGGGAHNAFRVKRHGDPRPGLPCWSASRPELPLSELPPCLGLPQHPDEHGGYGGATGVVRGGSLVARLDLMGLVRLALHAY